MEALSQWVLRQEYRLAKPASATQLRQVAPLMLSVSWVVFLHALQRHTRLTLRGWALPSVQAGAFQVLLCVIASGVPPTLAVTNGWCSGRGRAWGLFFQGLALLLASVSLPRRVVRLCVPPPEQPAARTPKAGFAAVLARLRCGLLATAFFLLLRPVNVAAEGLVGEHGRRAEMPEVVLDAILLIGGLAAAWWAGRDCRHDVLGHRVPAYSSVYHVTVAYSLAWSLTSVMTLCVNSRRENAVLAEMLKVVESAFAAAWMAVLLEPSKDPLVQMALTQSRPHEASEPDDDLIAGAKSIKGWRHLLCAVGLIFNIGQPFWEAIDEVPPKAGWQAARHEAIGQEVTPFDGPDSAAEVDEEAELEMFGREVVRGRNAWREWTGTSGVHPMWPGQQDQGAGREIVDPNVFTADEERLRANGVAFVRQSTWPFVLLDLYSNRVRSKPLAVVVVVTLAVRAIESDTATWITTHWENPSTALAVQLGCLTIMWIFCGLVLLGNNPYVDSRLGPVWVVVLALVMLTFAYKNTFDFFEAPKGVAENDAWSVGEVQERVDNLSQAFLALAGVFMVLRVTVQRMGLDDFHRSEMQALWYAADLLRPHGAVANLRSQPPVEGEKLRLLGRRGDDGEEASVERDHGDGTCDVVLTDGRSLQRVLHKDVKRDVGQHRVEEESKDKRLDRLKAVLSAAEEYPAALYFGAAASVPILIHLSCGVLQAVKGLVHKIYQAHVIAALLNFYLYAQVVGDPNGPGGLMTGPVAMATRVEAWRLRGGTGVATAERLAERGIPALYYRWGDGTEGDDRYPCSELKLGGKVLALVSYGGMGRLPGVHWQQLSSSLQRVAPAWGLPQRRVTELEDALHHLWRSISADDPAFVLGAAGMGELLCEAGLLMARPAAAVPEVVPIASSLARDFVGGLRDRLSVGRHQLDNATRQVKQPIIRKVVREAGLDLLSELEIALDNVTKTLAKKPEDPFAAVKDAGQTFKEYSEARAKDVAMDLAKQEAKQLGILAAQQLAAAAESQAKGAVKAGKAELKGKAEDLLADHLKKLDSASRDRLGNFTTNFIEREVKRYEKAAKAKLKRQLAKMVDGHMEQIKKDLEAQLPDSAKAISDDLNLGLWQIRRLGEEKTANEGGEKEEAEEEAGEAEEETEEKGKQAEEKGGAEAEAEAEAEEPAAAASLHSQNSSAEGKGEAEAEPEAAEGDPSSVSSMLQMAKEQASPFVNLFLTIVNILQQDWIAWALIGIKVGVRISLICAVACELYVMARAFRKYRTLFESMQSGKHDYVGKDSRESLAEGFAETTMFPGVFLGTSVIGFVLVATVTFLVIVVLVLLLLPMCAMQWLSPYWPVLKYILLTLGLKKFVQIVLMDNLLVDGGDIVYPGIFSLLWFIQLFLNFVIGLSTAVVRAVVVVLVAALSCCFVDFTLLPEPLVSLDTAYYSLLAMAYTHHERRNPLKMAAVTIMNGWVHRVHVPTQKAGETLEALERSARDRQPQVAGGEPEEVAIGVQPAEGGRPGAAGPASKSLLRVRSRFCLLLTLHRNPEIRRYRRPEVKPPVSRSISAALLGSLCSPSSREQPSSPQPAARGPR